VTRSVVIVWTGGGPPQPASAMVEMTNIAGAARRTNVDIVIICELLLISAIIRFRLES
jgi:hypothetical protein